MINKIKRLLYNLKPPLRKLKRFLYKALCKIFFWIKSFILEHQVLTFFIITAIILSTVFTYNENKPDYIDLQELEFYSDEYITTYNSFTPIITSSMLNDEFNIQNLNLHTTHAIELTEADLNELRNTIYSYIRNYTNLQFVRSISPTQPITYVLYYKSPLDSNNYRSMKSDANRLLNVIERVWSEATGELIEARVIIEDSLNSEIVIYTIDNFN